ncbi:hypothetical protein ACFQZE_16200 [Paenibacillus sp. GCM10027627]|uniref:hypothetical protein n=1 Tax=unclassified Paenibacillus TaxID=185978 RepID=UPI003645415E
MGKLLKRLCITLLVLLVLAGGGAWWLLSYIKPDKPLDLQYRPIDVGHKAMEMIHSFKPELVLTEPEVNDLIKKHLKRDIAKNVLLDGAEFQLEGDRLLADLNITYRDRIPAEVKVEYRMEWQEPNLVLKPESLHLKGIGLPTSMIDTLSIPLELPTGELVSVENVNFENDAIKVLFKIKLEF